MDADGSVLLGIGHIASVDLVDIHAEVATLDFL